MPIPPPVAVFEENRTIKAPHPRHPVPHLVLAFTSASAPWLYAALSKIHGVEGRDENVPGIGHFKVSAEAADAARRAILALGRKELPVPSVSALSGDAVGLIWGFGSKRIEVTAYPDQEVTYSVFDDGRLLRTGNVIDETPEGQLVCNRSALLDTFRWFMGEIGE
jgi:hypothetical protein